jgi:hypothetical protein
MILNACAANSVGAATVNGQPLPSYGAGEMTAVRRPSNGNGLPVGGRSVASAKFSKPAPKRYLSLEWRGDRLEAVLAEVRVVAPGERLNEAGFPKPQLVAHGPFAELWDKIPPKTRICPQDNVPIGQVLVALSRLERDSDGQKRKIWLDWRASGKAAAELLEKTTAAPDLTPPPAPQE